MISSFFGSFNFGSMAFAFGMKVDFGVGSVPGAGTEPLALRSSFWSAAPLPFRSPAHA